jgi:hypothetical protein
MNGLKAAVYGFASGAWFACASSHHWPIFYIAVAIVLAGAAILNTTMTQDRV